MAAPLPDELRPLAGWVAGLGSVGKEPGDVPFVGPDEAPLHVVAIGATTNIASALLLEPRIVDRIVVSWTSANPTWAGKYNHSFDLE